MLFCMLEWVLWRYANFHETVEDAWKILWQQEFSYSWYRNNSLNCSIRKWYLICSKRICWLIHHSMYDVCWAAQAMKGIVMNSVSGLFFLSHRLCSRFSERNHRGEILFSELAEPPRRGRAHAIQECHHIRGAGSWESEKHRPPESNR